MGLKKIISGGQTGVDRAALDACLKIGFPCGGWCPKDRKAEDGPIPQKYPLEEIQHSGYEFRTKVNVEKSDATLIVYDGDLSGGTLVTFNYANEIEKPVFLFRADIFFIDKTLEQLIEFLDDKGIVTLNIAGPRASQWNDAYNFTNFLCSKLISKIFKTTINIRSEL